MKIRTPGQVVEGGESLPDFERGVQGQPMGVEGEPGCPAVAGQSRGNAPGLRDRGVACSVLDGTLSYCRQFDDSLTQRVDPASELSP